MIRLDRWQEIYDTVSRNKLRTALTAFSVAWGIFMLIILLGSGQGLRNGFEQGFRDDAINSIWIWGGTTSIPYKGLQPNRNIQLRNGDMDYIKQNLTGVEYMTARYNRWNQPISYGQENGSYWMRAVTPEHQMLENTIMVEGRYLNKYDVEQMRKVAIVGRSIVNTLFKGESPLGKYINTQGMNFKVVGVFKDEGSEREEEIFYIPLTTAQRLFNAGDQIHQIMFTTGNATVEQSIYMAEQVTSMLAARHLFDPADENAVYVDNNTEEFTNIMSVLNAITLFVWIIGIMTIIAGVVGIGNIMMITVKERTREIGIRKAVGASPYSVVQLIMQEAIVITAFAGYLGLFAGIYLLEFFSSMIGDGEGGDSIFVHPEVDLNLAIIATLLLILAGAVAGYIPARRAAAIKPIEALRDE